MSREYSKELANAVIAYAEKYDFNYNFDEDDGWIYFTFNLGTVFGAIHLGVKIREDSLVYKAYVDAKAKDEYRFNVLEYMNRVNCSIGHGCFQMDLETGDILFKCAAYFDLENISENIINQSFKILNYVYDIYGDELMNVMLGIKSAKNAFYDADNDEANTDAEDDCASEANRIPIEYEQLKN